MGDLRSNSSTRIPHNSITFFSASFSFATPQPLFRSPISTRARSVISYYWAPHSCRIALHDGAAVEATDEKEAARSELQQCFDRRGITSVRTEGMSIAEFFGGYLTQRLTAIGWFCPKKNSKYACVSTLVNGEGGNTATLHSFELPHVLWKKPLQEWRTVLRDRVRKSEAQENTTGSVNFHMWGFGPFISSEREAGVLASRVRDFANVARQELKAHRKWREIDWFAPGAAFTFDTSAQLDGMHGVLDRPLFSPISSVPPSSHSLLLLHSPHALQ